MPETNGELRRIFLDKVHLKGYKSIEDLTIDFQKGLNILIGKNGSGKTNLMEFLFQVTGHNRSNKPLYNYSKVDLVSDDDHSFILELEKIIQTKADKQDIDERVKKREKIIVDKTVIFDYSIDKYNTVQFEFKNSNLQFFQFRSSLRTLFDNLGYYYIYPLFIRFDLPVNLACISTSGSVKINLEEQQFGTWETPETLSFISDIFWQLELAYDEVDAIMNMVNTDFHNRLQSQLKYDILENLKLYSPIEDIKFNSNINLYKTEKELIVENIKLEFKINGNWLPWSQLSDGTRRLFYIIAEVTNTNGLVLIEEPELGIHPHQFNLLMTFLKEQSEDKQIIISTHAPKALDHLTQKELNNIILTYYDSKKGTQMRHLTSKEVEKAKLYLKDVGFFSDYWLMSDLEE